VAKPIDRKIRLTLPVFAKGTDLKKAVKDSFRLLRPFRKPVPKQELSKLDHLTSPEVIITSNTLRVEITDIADMQHTGANGAHILVPAYLVPLVEVVIGEKTDQAVAAQLHKLLLAGIKHLLLSGKDLPGAARPHLTGSYRRPLTLYKWAWLRKDVDTAIKMGMGSTSLFRPLEHNNAVGLDLALSVQSAVLPVLITPILPDICKSWLSRVSGLQDGESHMIVKDVKELPYGEIVYY
jgi:3-hydroxybutyryl-CoA dehydrogenase